MQSVDKKILFLLVSIALFGLAGFAFAQVAITNPLSAQNFGQLLTQIADGVGTLVASIGIIMIIIAGILYLFSAGRPEKIKTANAAIMYAVVGIVIGLAAKAIVAIIKNIIGA